MSLSAAARQMSEARRELHSAPPPDAATVFLSYASTDRSHIEALASFIEASGYSVWWDRSIDPGEFFNDRIAKSIDASFAVVVLWSKHSTISRWVNWEARRGFSQNKLSQLAHGEFDRVTEVDRPGERGRAVHQADQAIDQIIDVTE